MKLINNRLLFMILMVASLLVVKKASSTHVAGGYIQFECTGTPGQYTISLHLYRDCSGINLPNTTNLQFTNTCGLGNFNVSMSNPTVNEVSQICPQQINNTECNGGNLPGYEEWVYTATVNLGACNSWNIGYSMCCHNGSNNLNGQPNFFVTTQLNTATNNCNSTPVVTAQPEPFVCVNQPVSYNLGASEPNGNTIQYSFSQVQTSFTGNATYTPPYSSNQPIPGINIDPTTGTVTFTPNQLGAWVIVIQMTEIDANGNVVSVTNYEYQTFVINCNNTAPQPPSAVPGGGVSNVTGSIVQNGPNSLTMCQGFQGCFDVVFSDPDPADILTVQSNLATVLPGATITQSGTNPLTISVCWTPTTTSGVVTLSFLVEDNACPIIGQNNYAASIDVVNPGIPNVVTTTEVCGGTNEGTATITMAGGVAPFTYNITGPATSSNGTGSFTNLPPGTYNYTVNTGGGCDVSGTFNIIPGPPMPLTVSGNDVTCNALCDGNATANPGGVAPYTYVWEQGGTSIGQNTQTASGLCAGTYDVTVFDNNGCSNTETIIITEPPALNASLTPTATLCNGSCDGQVDVTGIVGGTPTYQYAINGGAQQAGTNFSGLCQGAQQVVITDQNNCTLTLNTTVTEPTPVSVAITNTVPATCGNNNGEVTVAGNGGTAPYQYSIGGPNQAATTFTGLASGSYTVTIIDDNGCTATTPVTINAVAQPTAFVDTQTDLSCFGGNNGTVLIGNTGAVAPITYSLNGGPGQASNTFNNLAAGPYTVDITDANGCTASTSFTITQPTVLQYTSTPNDATCNGLCDGQIQINATGGTPPYQYSSNNGLSFSTNNPMTGLCAGNVEVVVQDANGCLSNSIVPVNEPAPLSATFNLTDPVCEGVCDGEIVVNASGGSAPYQYSVNGGVQQIGTTLTGLCAGNQNLLIEDNNGCQFTSTETLTDPPGITINQVSMTPSNCGFNDGQLEVAAAGVNPPFQYSINGSPNFPTGVFNNMLAGGYNITVIDALGCQESVFFGVNDIQMSGTLVSQTDVSCFGGSDGTVEVINTAGAAPISFELDNSGITQTNGNFGGMAAGSHLVTIYDAGLCVFTIPFTINQPDEIAFTTNIGDIACSGGATGSIEFTNITGGVGNYQYSIDGGFNFQAGTTFNGLTAGTYNLVVMDDNNCMVGGTATITQAAPITFTTNDFDLQCNGDNTGVIQFVANGGTGAYSYSIDGGATFQASSAFVSLPAGNYNLVVQDAAACQEVGTTTLNEPAQLTANYVTSDALCNGVCDGEIQITANGGTTPYQYSIDNGTTFTSNNNIVSICASTFTVVIQDDNGCSINSLQAVNEPTQVTFTSTETSSTCGDANGQIEINANGGTPGYTYSINNGTTFTANNISTGLMAGTFNIVVEDQNNCPATGTQAVTNEASPVVNFVTTTNPLCNGAADGTVEVTASGGTGALNYILNGGATQAGNVFTGVPAGNHTVEVIDVNGCSDTETFTLTDPPLLTFTSTPTDLSCFQNSTGSINVTPNGGTPPYQYSFDNGGTFGSSPINGFIAAGNYNIVVQDAKGCQANGTETVNEPPLLEFNSITPVDASCNSYCDGTITLDVIGGTAPYSYNWVQGVAGPTSNIANNLCTSTYDFIVTDDNGCIISDNVFIDEPDSVEITSIFETNVVCNGDCDGTVEIIAPTGAQYSIDGGASFQAANFFDNLCPGDYDIVVQDNVGCLVENEFSIWEPDPISLDLRDDTTVCFGINDTIYAWGIGGIQPYTFQWNTPTTDYYHDYITNTTTTFEVQIIDDNGCTIPMETTTVTVIPQVDVTVLSDTLICPGGTATLTAQGIDGLPNYSYAWSTGETGPTISVSPSVATTYTATVTDQCQDDASGDVLVDFHPLPEVNFAGDQLEGCAPLTVEFANTTPLGQVGTNCTWNINGANYPGCTDAMHTFNDPGCYDVTLTVQSPEGCYNDTTFSNYICIYPNPVANFNFTPVKPTVISNSVTFNNQSIGEETYQWDFSAYGGSTVENPTVIFNGAQAEEMINVCLEVTSEYGCVDEACAIVTIYDEFTIYVPNAFTPDEDRFNPVFLPIMPPTVDVHEYELLIFNRWGELIFESQNYKVGWDGTFKDQIVQDGVYVWQIRLEEGPEKTKRTYRGHVTLLR